MRIEIVPALQHRPADYAPWHRGYSALSLIDDNGRHRGELVWRLSSGHAVEVTEFGIYDEADRRRGHGTRLLNAGLEDMRAYAESLGQPLGRVYLFCDAIDTAGRLFYEARGFRAAAVLPAFYHYCDAVLYVMDTT